MPARTILRTFLKPLLAQYQGPKSASHFLQAHEAAYGQGVFRTEQKLFDVGLFTKEIFIYKNIDSSTNNPVCSHTFVQFATHDIGSA
jgi:hypothetical protein